MEISWPWRFVTPSEEEKLLRRELLDLRGSYAQWSIIAVIIVLRVYQGWAKSVTATELSSKQRRGPTSWWDRPIAAGWLETRRQYALCGLWLLWLFSLSVWNSGEDYMHLTKALGHVALSQIPLQVLMSPAAYISTSKPAASSIFSFVTSIPQATVTPYHRLFGRMVISPLLVGHATLYLSFFIETNHPEFGSLLNKRVRDLDVQCGLFAISMVISLIFYVRPRGAALKTGTQGRSAAGSMQERRRSFYYGHISLVALLCFAAYYHVLQAQKYMVQALGAFLVNGVFSWVVVRWGERR
ncbi:uncharacterized protein N7496_009853 [Penicillium cataractarum]|uniref:Ferric oxidoreductase domain-containing protein n=1 Tax=Penicillium cataractarum TaxID=2100454 RepID=A0A9W9RR44_9EURO|nr:uncharacterized protein N7496_009853 [Penicillium cataractarum]KAJ5364140.1 hypothetical protein N7496_009853 [Penicillium cataractarum]